MHHKRGGIRGVWSRNSKCGCQCEVRGGQTAPIKRTGLLWELDNKTFRWKSRLLLVPFYWADNSPFVIWFVFSLKLVFKHTWWKPVLYCQFGKIGNQFENHICINMCIWICMFCIHICICMFCICICMYLPQHFYPEQHRFGEIWIKLENYRAKLLQKRWILLSQEKPLFEQVQRQRKRPMLEWI